MRLVRPLGRHSFIVAATTILAVVATACAPPDRGESSRRSEGDTIRIGLLRPITGSVAASGKDMETGWNLYWDQHGNTVAGKKIETIVEDDAGNPSVALNKANQLSGVAKVHMVVGPLLSSSGLAVADFLNRKAVPLILPIVAADDLTQRHRLPYVVRLAGWTSSQTTHPLGEYAYEQGMRRAVTICTDYAFGYESCGGFVNTFTDKGGTILKQLWNPLGTPDFSSYMADIERLRPDVVFAEQVGADSVRFIKAYNEFGLKRTIPLLGNQTIVDQSALRSMGSMADGIVSIGHYAEGRNVPATRQFVDAYHQKFKLMPSYYAADMYAAAAGIKAAIEAMKGDVSDPRAFVQALKNVSLATTPMGPQRLDGYGNPVFDVYVRRVEQGPYGPWNVPFRTYPNVGQFWTYDPQAFLRHPVYSKRYQGNGVWPSPAS